MYVYSLLIGCARWFIGCMRKHASIYLIGDLVSYSVPEQAEAHLDRVFT